MYAKKHWTFGSIRAFILLSLVCLAVSACQAPVNTAVSSDVTLSSLDVSSGTLTPVFAAGATSYSVSVDNSVTSETVTATPTNSSAAISGNGTTNLSVGENTISVVVTAADGTTTQTYTIVVSRAAPDNVSEDATLSELVLSAGKISPAFSASTTSYTAKVANSVSSITVSATTTNSKATMSGSGVQDLSVGANKISIIVTLPMVRQRKPILSMSRESLPTPRPTLPFRP